MKRLHYRNKVLILVSLLLLNSLFSVVLVTTIIDPSVSSFALTSTFRSLVLFPSPLLFGNQRNAVLVNHSVFDYGIWFNTSNFERALVKFDFNADFTNITHIESYNMTFLRNESSSTNSSIMTVVTADGQQLYVLGTNVNQGTFSVYVININTLTITKTFAGNCMVSNSAPMPFNDCQIDDITLWNNSLWLLEGYQQLSSIPNNGIINTYASVLVAYSLPSFKFEANYTLTESSTSTSSYTIFKILTSLPNGDIPSLTNTLALESPIFGFNDPQTFYSSTFNPSTHILRKIAWQQAINEQDAKKVFSFYPLASSGLITSSGVAIAFLSSPFDSEYTFGLTTWTIAPTIPPFPLLPLVFNMSMYIVIVLIVVRDKNMKILGKSLIERFKIRQN